ncbi:MAG: hypothetical protein HYY37_04620 [Candidatus Aenigmarchaeota archaeon]|nr:hypothetical protein [Candidatus Aenigmarchaeota archaeon]
MVLAFGEHLYRELEVLLRRTLPDFDEPSVRYLACRLATAENVPFEVIRLYRTGLEAEMVPETPRQEAYKRKLGLSQRIGDGCLVHCIFYDEDRDPERTMSMQRGRPIRPAPASYEVPSVDRRSSAHEKPPGVPSASKTPIQPGIILMNVGKSGYHMAELYAALLDLPERSVYARLADNFPEIIARVGPHLQREYLGVTEPPQRVVLHKPGGGKTLLRVRMSAN